MAIRLGYRTNAQFAPNQLWGLEYYVIEISCRYALTLRGS